MSFKSRLIDYCEGIKIDCPHCPFREPCDNVTPALIPSGWSDAKFDEMRSQTWFYMRKIGKNMAEITKVMLDASEDDVKDAEKRLSTWKMS